jgi:hypothetical protein
VNYQKTSQAMAAGPQPLQPFGDSSQGFSYARAIQPILDQHCVSCHDVPNPNPDFNGDRVNGDDGHVFSLLATEIHDPYAKRIWSESYLALTKAYRGEQDHKRLDYRADTTDLVSFVGSQSVPTMLPPYFAGSAKSGLMKLLKDGHGEVELSDEELDMIACWIDLNIPFCGDYREAHAWTEDEIAFYDRYQKKRDGMADIEHANIQLLLSELHK